MDYESLRNVCKRIPGVSDIFTGVFPINAIPYGDREPPYCFIFNDSPADEDGHWVAFYRPTESITELFDSTGYNAYPLLEKLKKETTVTITIPNIIQNPVSEMCGGYCLYFLVHRICKGRSFSSIMSDFDEDVISNDQIVRIFIRDLISFVYS